MKLNSNAGVALKFSPNDYRSTDKIIRLARCLVEFVCIR
jgi:hypothetical protein